MFMNRVNYWASLISNRRECSNFGEKTSIAFKGLYEQHSQRIFKKSVNNFGVLFKSDLIFLMALSRPQNHN